MKLFEMDKSQMRQLNHVSVFSFLLSSSISVLSLVLLRIYSNLQASPKATVVPTGFIILDLVLDDIIALVSLTAIYFHVTRKRLMQTNHKNLHQILLMLLASSTVFSLPFRTLAELVRGPDGFPNQYFLVSRDVMTAIGSTFLLIFLWSYPTVWSDHGNDGIQTYRVCLCALYSLLRIGFSVVPGIHTAPLPLQSFFTLAGIFLHRHTSSIDQVHYAPLLLLCLMETFLVITISVNYKRCARKMPGDTGRIKHLRIIALWYQKQPVLILFLSAIASSITALFSPLDQALKIYSQTGILILSGPTGGSAISLAILFYALGEVYVHNSWEQTLLLPFHSSSKSQRWREWPQEKLEQTQNGFLYRIADERGPQNEDPIPQHHTFSFESAVLLFNVSWLSTTYASEGIKPLTPADFGRPMCVLRAVVSNPKSTVVAIILERMDRLIVAFKPALPSVDKLDELRSLNGTEFGRTLKNESEFQERLPVRDHPAAITSRLRGCKAHSGYTCAYSSIQGALHSHIQELTMNTHRPLYITGFSSGGALATICAFDLGLRTVSDTNAVSLYTYGSPRAMNGKMVSVLEAVVPCRWRCVVAGDSNTVKPSRCSYRHYSKVATFTRSGHLALELVRRYKWWQCEVSEHAMHNISAYFCAFAKWHKMYHMKGSIDLWDWQVDKAISALFSHQIARKTSMHTSDFVLESPVVDVETHSLRTITDSERVLSRASLLDDVIAFAR